MIDIVTFNEVVTFVIVAMGVITVGMSFFVAHAFRRHMGRMRGDGRSLTRALMLQLFGECTIGAVTLGFAVAAYSGHLSDWPTWFQSLLRCIMFAATSWTTFHLWRTVEKLHGSR